MNTVIRGTTQTLRLSIIDEQTPTNNPITGESPTIAIRRLSDDKWYDFIAATWDTFASYSLIEASNKQSLTDKGDGTYEHDWDQSAADASATREYEMVFEVPSGSYQGIDYERWSFIEGWPLTSAERSAVADAVLDEEFDSAAVTDDSLRSAAKAAWAQGFGRWVLSGTTLTIYGVDGSAVRVFTIDDADEPTSRTPV